MKNPTFANRWNADVIDDNYLRWIQKADSVDHIWRAFFEGFELARNGMDQTGTSTSSGTAGLGDEREGHPGVAVAAVDPKKQARFIGAIYAFRSIGHTQAHFNPIKFVEKNPRLTLERLGFTEDDLDSSFDTGNYLGGKQMTLRQLLEELESTYCGSIGVEYLHIQETARRRWLQTHMEPVRNRPEYSRERKIRILEQVLEGELFEKFLHNRYTGQKRFGLEGAETLIAALDFLIEQSPQLGIKEAVMGMAHRGRLNVLANILGKSYEFIFHEFSADYVPETIYGDGDVKYHLGYTTEITTASGSQITMHLAANPSHLEAVNPIVEGRARARQRILNDQHRKLVLPILIHGDAAFAGQGLVAEVLNLSKLPGYTTGGTIHFIINNQIGFTTDPSEARSSLYCSDVAKMVEAPIFHVNGDDPVAVVWTVDLAAQYRQEFGADVVIDMYCYRRHGHNEADEPAFTQPKLYKQISTHPLISDTYLEQLCRDGDITPEEAVAFKDHYRKTLEDAFARVQEEEAEHARVVENEFFSNADRIDQPPYSFRTVKTRVEGSILERVARQLTHLPETFTPNPKIKRQLEQKWKTFQNSSGIDWSFAESLAWGTLLLDGIPVRLSGQDSARGTFSQRHAVLYDNETRERYLPLMALEGRRGLFCVHNSMLSEAAVLGFDYGYSLDYPQMLCMWEAQFGDFVNGAQVIIDQFISSCESKWAMVSGIVLLLPHGYEGQGPEHSSARLERMLQLCAEQNIQVCNLTTPAQYFHVLRRQMKRDFHKPLIIAAPKSLLRNKEAVSKNEEFTQGQFEEILNDPEPAEGTRRIILCSGKIFYELLQYRREHDIDGTTVLRIEQIYPFHRNLFRYYMENYPDIKRLVWCQEESKNSGAWSFVAPIVEEIAGRKPFYAGRDASASPAVGSLAVHRSEQQALIEAAFHG